jgi:hypothetical protein
LADRELFAGVLSVVVEEMFAVPVMTVLPATVEPTRTTNVNVEVLPLPMFVVRVQVLVPVPPTGGLVQFHVPAPAVFAAETNVVLAGVAKVTDGVFAEFGPLFMTTTVNVICPFGETGEGAAVLEVTARSACAEAVCGIAANPATRTNRRPRNALRSLSLRKAAIRSL